jgi:hypothetical protein
MWGIVRTRAIHAAVLAPLGILGLATAGCGGKDFENKPRPPVPVQLTGVITKQRVTISPNNVGGGPITITVSNQTNDSHTVTLGGDECHDPKGASIEERVGPINPLDTATLQKTVGEGECLVEAGSDQAAVEEILPARLFIGPERPSGKNKLLLP